MAYNVLFNLLDTNLLANYKVFNRFMIADKNINKSKRRKIKYGNISLKFNAEYQILHYVYRHHWRKSVSGFYSSGGDAVLFNEWTIPPPQMNRNRSRIYTSDRHALEYSLCM